MKHFFSLLQHIFFDVVILFKNFFHWNASKIIHLLFGYLLWAWLALPFILLIIAILYLFIPELSFNTIFQRSLTQTLSLEDFAPLFSNSFLAILLFVFAVLGFFLFQIGKSYNYVLNLAMYKSYLSGERRHIFSSFSFHPQTIINYIKIFLLNSFLFIAPFIISGLLFICILFFSGGILSTLSIVLKQGQVNYFTISLFLLFLITCLVAVYLNYRSIFSVVDFIHHDFWKSHQKKALHFIKKSFEITTGIKKLVQFLIIFVLFGIIFLPLEIIKDIEMTEVKNRSQYVTLIEKASQTWASLEDEELDTLEYLGELYTWENGNDMIGKIDTHTNMVMILSLISFLIVSGVSEMILYSFYLHWLQQK